MAYTLAVTWKAREGEEEAVRRVLETVAPMVRAEPGCRMFLVHRSPDDPRTFFLYEQFDDEAAFRAHTETEHFATWVLGEAVPRLELRERAVYETLDGS